jgi:Ser/Thr protein kinase RdoA (MazF antagonist)
MYESVLTLVLEKLNIKYLRVFGCQKGYRNEIWPVLTDGGQMINVTFYKREAGIVDRINRADAVSEYLGLSGLSTRKRIDSRILSLKNGEYTTYIGVYNYLPGNTIPWEAYTMEHIKTLGGTMSNMHTYLSQMPSVNLPSVYDEYLTIIEQMENYFSKSEVASAIEYKLDLRINTEKLSQYKKLLQKYRKMSGQQSLHMDFVRGNVLFEGARISGILDFEKTALGHPIVDIARTLAFLLVDCKYKSTEKVYKYFLYSGYQKRGLNKDAGNDLDRNKFIEMFLFYDLYKFLIHNPYEALNLNEHYVRTRDILVKYDVVLLY